ncbi:MAG TPA: hypothetical protein EYP92_03630 [Candidatus Thioglobus sp.]|nr:hypothetical protein [Candidatus Thioglobus sp.]
MKVTMILISLLAITGCATNKGIIDLKQFETSQKLQVVILKDGPTRGSVLPVLIKWFSDNGYSSKVIMSLQEAKPDNYVFSYRAWWGWDMATYMRKVEMRVKSKGETFGNLDFDALQYGAFGKFGSSEKRLLILLDALFGKITHEKANELLGNV